MSRAIICLVFVIVLSSTSDGRFIDKRSFGGASEFGDQINKAGDFDSDAIQSAIESALEEKLKDAFSKDAGSAIGDFFGGLGRKKRNSGVDGVEHGVGSGIWDRIDKGVAAVGDFPLKIEIGLAGGTHYSRFKPFKNLILEETRAYAAKALGKYYGNLLYKSFN